MTIVPFLFLVASCQALPAKAAGELRIGVQDNLGYEQTIKAWTPTAEYLSAKLGRKVSLVPLSTLESPYALESSEVDLLLAGPVTQELLHRNIEVDFLLTLERRLGNTLLNGDGATVFHLPGRIGGIAGLRGRKAAATFRNSIAVIALKNALRKEGSKVKPPSMYFTGDAATVLKEVRQGDADAGIVPTSSFYRALEGGQITPGEFDVLRFGEAPTEPSFCSTRIYQGLILSALADTDRRATDGIIRALLAMPAGHRAAAAGYYTRWTHASHNHELQDAMTAEGLITPGVAAAGRAWSLYAAAAALAVCAALMILWRRTRYCQPLLARMPQPALVVAGDCTVLYANPAAHEALGIKDGGLAGTKCYASAHGLDKPLPECAGLMSGKTKGAVCIEHFNGRLGKDLLIEAHPLSGGRVLCMTRDAANEKGRETRLYHSAQIEAMSRLSAAMAHQFNNVLSVISAGIHILRAPGARETDRTEAMTAIDSAARSGAGLTRQLLTLSRSNIIRKAQLDLRQTVADVLKIFASQQGAPEIETSFQGEIPAVVADPLEISRLLQHLLSGREMIAPTGEPVKISVSSLSLARPGKGGTDPLFARLAVSRLCAGFDKAAIREIFEPGLETSRWGLALAYAIAKRHGGWIDASYSWAGVLAFDVYLPAGGTVTAAPGRAAGKEQPAGDRDLRVLLAEDDEDLRLMTARMLESEGHSVSQAGDGAAAEGLLARERFDVLVSDIVMPGMSGTELAKAAEKISPGIRVILMSGHSDSRLDPEEARSRGWHFMQKPFDAEKLVRLLKDRGPSEKKI